jgi:hypothetical protein
MVRRKYRTSNVRSNAAPVKRNMMSAADEVRRGKYRHRSNVRIGKPVKGKRCRSTYKALGVVLFDVPGVVGADGGSLKSRTCVGAIRLNPSR